MSKRVDKWLKKGRKNCKKGEHWYILQFPNCLYCPVCGHREKDDGTMPEYNTLLVCEMKWEMAGSGG